MASGRPLYALQAQAYPLMRCHGVVSEQSRCPVFVIDDDIDIAIVVQIANGHPASHVILVEVRADVACRQPKPSSLQVVMQQRRLGVRTINPSLWSGVKIGALFDPPPVARGTGRPRFRHAGAKDIPVPLCTVVGRERPRDYQVKC